MAQAVAAEWAALPAAAYAMQVKVIRGARIAALEKLLEHMAAQPGVRFMTGEAIAAHALAAGLPAEGDPVTPHPATPTIGVRPEVIEAAR